MSSRRPKIAMIADDLTGANDSGVQFTKDGFTATVLFQVDAENLQMMEEDALIVDTDSRAMKAQDAYHQVRKVTGLIHTASYDIFYKKIDSTLRGNIGVEIAAMQEVGGFDLVVIAPAFPEAGRVTIDGVHYVNDVPIDQTAFAQDPHTPVTNAHIPTFLKKQVHQPVNILPAVNYDWSTIDESVPWLVFDAKTDEDLRQVIDRATAGRHKKILWVGSAGLASHLSKWMQNKYKNKVLIVAGSTSEVTAQQVEHLLEKKDIVGIPIVPGLLFSSGGACNERKRLLPIIEKAYAQKKDVIIYSDAATTPGSEMIDLAVGRGYEAKQAREIVAGFLGKLATDVIQAENIERLILTGGEIAKSVSRALSVQGFTLKGELETGIPISRMMGTNILAVTKAGAYGNPESFVHAYEYFKEGGGACG